MESYTKLILGKGIMPGSSKDMKAAHVSRDSLHLIILMP